MKIDRDFARDLIAAARSRGADQAEVYVRQSRRLSVEIKDQEIDALISAEVSGYSLRVIMGSRLGFSFSTDTGRAGAVVADALDAARSTDKNDAWGLPAGTAAADVAVFDPAVDSLGEDALVATVKILEQSSFAADPRIRKVRKVSGSVSSSYTLIMNSEGVDAAFPSTACSLQAMVVGEEGGDSRTGWDFESSRFLRDLSPAKTAGTAASRAIRLLGAGKMKAMRAAVILDSSSAVDFLDVFAASLSSDAVQKGKSFLAGRLGTRVASPIITVVDSGILSGRVGSRPVDDEGVRTGEKLLIDQGILQGYLYTTYTARKEGRASTGNAVRAGFSSFPSVGITNLSITSSAGTGCLATEGLFRSAERGLYVTDVMGMHTANPVSGDFSVGVSGLLIEGGMISHPVKEAVITGNLLDLFQRIEACGDDFRFYGNTGSPSLFFPDVDISA